jgi:hypothetical protein
MAIQDAGRQRRERQQLTRCPLPWCNEDLSGKKKTSNHFYTKHTPEDFGLSPLGERSNGGETDA